MKAYAKLNLTLDVVGVRPDGYHLLRTIMTSIDLFDTVTVNSVENDEIRLYSDVSLPEKNTLISAAQAMRELTGRGAVISLTKRIPSQAGMGGASADAAAVLSGMRKLYAPHINDAELIDIGARLGADVPFCLKGGLALCEGIGEKLTPLPYTPMDFLIAKPQSGMSTAQLFSEFKLDKSFDASATAVKAIRLKNMRALARCISNDLEKTCESHISEVGELCAKLLGYKADAAAMTGSGSAVFGLFLGEARHENIQNAAHALADIGFYTVIASSVPRGVDDD